MLAFLNIIHINFAIPSGQKSVSHYIVSGLWLLSLLAVGQRQRLEGKTLHLKHSNSGNSKSQVGSTQLE
jgi:hypothetical protein